jgi:hypothetical protein
MTNLAERAKWWPSRCGPLDQAGAVNEVALGFVIQAASQAPRGDPAAPTATTRF